MIRDGEIVELKRVTNGRSCESHECCGMHIWPDGLIRFELCIACINGKTEESIKAVHICDGTESCTIGFLYGQIIELYDNPNMRCCVEKATETKELHHFIY